MTDIKITITVAKDGSPTVKLGDTPLPITVRPPMTRTVKHGSIFTRIKRDVLDVLKARQHKKTTRKYLQRELGITTSQVYNAIHQLRADGWNIDSRNGSGSFGYRLVG